MKPVDFFHKLTGLEKPNTELSLSPGPFRILVGPNDAMAAELLLWLEDHMPEDATMGDLYSVLDAAKWWATFWAAQPIEHNDG